LENNYPVQAVWCIQITDPSSYPPKKL